MRMKTVLVIALGLAGCSHEDLCDSKPEFCAEPGAEADGGDSDTDAGDSETDAGMDEEPESLVPASFTRVTIDSSGGESGGTGECSSSRVTSFSVEGPSRTLSWDYCQYRTSGFHVERGSRTLSDHEFQAVLNTLSFVRPSDNPVGGFDKPNVTLTVEADGISVTYQDDFYPSREGLRLVEAIDLTHELLSSLASGAWPPAEIEALTFWFANHGRKEPTSAPQCDWQLSRYELSIETRELSWKLCEPRMGTDAYKASEGSRALSADEVSTILTALAKLELGASKPCAELPRLDNYWSFIGVQAKDDVYSLLYEEAASCPAQFSDAPGGGYAIGFSDVEQVVKALAP